MSDDASKDIKTGNTLNIGTSDKPAIGLSAKNIRNFETINFYLPSNVANNAVALNLTGANNTDLSKTSVYAYLSNASNLTKDSVIHLISTQGTLVDFDEANGKANLTNVNIAGLINVTGKIALDSTSKNLDLTFNDDEDTGGSGTGGGSSITANENSKQLLETNLAGVASINNAGNLLSENLDKITPKDSNANIFAFGFIGGSDKRYKTGSHIDLKGFSANVGIATKDESGRLTAGIFAEYGKADFETYLDNGLEGKGDTKFMGGGLFAKFVAQSNFYGEGSIRLGKIKTNSDKGMYNEYELSSSYYGAHVGLGKIFELNNTNNLDIYTKYFYSHTDSANTTISGVDVNFAGIASSRVQVGVKDTIKFSETSSLYAGLAYQYEAKGKAEGSVSVLNQSAGIASPSLKGSTGIAELGYAYETNSIKFDIGAKGYTGKEKGYSGNVGVTVKF